MNWNEAARKLHESEQQHNAWKRSQRRKMILAIIVFLCSAAYGIYLITTGN